VESKIQLYLEFGAREVWVFYPNLRSIVVRFPGGSRVIRNGDNLETSLLLGFSLKISEIFV